MYHACCVFRIYKQPGRHVKYRIVSQANEHVQIESL